MIRTSLVAFASLFLAAVLVANEPASEPPCDLETIAIGVMYSAFLANDSETVETLFDKLSPENKKRFLLGASSSAHEKHATQFLARLTLSLFEQAAEKTADCRRQTAAEYRTALQVAPLGEQPVPPAPPFVVPRHGDDGYITLNSYGRVYIKGLNASEIVEAVKFHLARYITNEKQARGDKVVRGYYVGDIVGATDTELHFPGMADIVGKILKFELWEDRDAMITMNGATHIFTVRQTEEIHVQIEELLNQIRKAKEENEKSESHSTVLPFGCCLLYHKSRNRVERNDERSLSCEIPIAPNFWEWAVTDMPKPWKMDVIEPKLPAEFMFSISFMR